MYDIYLTTGCDVPPLYLENEKYKQLLTPTTKTAHLLETHPGFLGLDISQVEARQLLTKLKAQGARGWVVPTVYRQPKVTQEQAFAIASQAIAHEQITHFSEFTFQPVRFKYDDPMRWVFMAISEDLIAEGYSPGALHASIDKLDGHVWQEEEYERYFGGE